MGCMVIFVLVVNAPWGTWIFIFPSVLVRVPPAVPMVFELGAPSGVPGLVIRGEGAGAAGSESDFLQAVIRVITAAINTTNFFINKVDKVFAVQDGRRTDLFQVCFE